MSIWNGLLSLLSGGLSGVFTADSSKSAGDNLGNAMSNWGNSLGDLSNQNPIGNAAAKYLGTRLTDAEQQANAFSAGEAEKNRAFQQRSADIAWERELMASNTQYQRRVADMQAAGINPILAATGGASVPQAPVAVGSGASSVQPSSAGANLGSLLSLAMQFKMLPAQLSNIAADTATKEATASKIAEDTRGAQIINDFNARTADDRARAAKAAADLNEKEVEKAGR